MSISSCLSFERVTINPDVDDNHKGIVVMAVNDSAKPEAFWKSDLLKQKRAESGVVEDAEPLVYRVIRR